MRVDAKQAWCAELKCSTAELAVFLNDVLLDGCIAADTDEGWADVYAKTSRGSPKLDAARNMIIERRHGAVDVKRWKRKSTK